MCVNPKLNSLMMMMTMMMMTMMIMKAVEKMKQGMELERIFMMERKM